MQIDPKHLPLKPFPWEAFRLARLLIALGLAIALAGCSEGGSTTSQSRIRTFNAYISASGIDPSLSVTSGVTSLSGGGALGFGLFSSGGSYVSVPSGAFTASVTGVGAAAPFSFVTTPTLNGNNAPYTLVAAGQAGQTGVLLPQLVAISNYTPDQFIIASGSAAIRVVNVSLNPNAIGLYATTNGSPTTAINGGFASVSYGISASTGYASVPTTQLLNFALVDSTSPQTALPLSGTSNLNSSVFAAGQAYTLYIYGQPGNTAEPLGATWVQDFPAP